MSSENTESTDAAEDGIKGLLARVKQLETEGLERRHAFGIATLEERIGIWQENWGDNLPFLIFGDFQAPEADLHFEELGITVYHEQQKNTLVKGTCVLKATVWVQQRSVAGLPDAVRRINVLLGAFVLIGWGNGSCQWWSWIVHPPGGGGYGRISHEEWKAAIASILGVPDDARQRLEAALYWIREPNRSLLESRENEVLRRFSAYWNAFECVVEAVNLLRAPRKMSRSEKQKKINDYLAERSGNLTPGDITKMYQQIVNPGFVGKAEHALRVCFDDGAEVYI
ncbi:MAG TPA: hypothetical protein VMY37_21270 [Thermoguttaceae bacterium]|nr:hypothetical protein [Thermoguttaceae bacterium]